MHDRQEGQTDSEQIEPQDEEQRERDIFIVISSVDDLHDYKWEADEQADHRWSSEVHKDVFHNAPYSTIAWSLF